MGGVFLTAEIVLGLLGIGVLSTGVLVMVGRNQATVSHIKEKVVCIDDKLKEVRDVMISMPCTEYNGRIKVIPGFSHGNPIPRNSSQRGVQIKDLDISEDSKCIYDFPGGGFKQ